MAKKRKKRAVSASANKSGGQNRSTGVRLIFPPSPGQNKGFTASSSSSFDSNPASTVRELIQNSLDAALVDGEQEKAKVRFVIEEHRSSEIPGMKEYQEALDSRKRHDADGKGNRQTSDVSDSIAGYAKNESVNILFVMDNGIGLDKKRIGAMLGDGISCKSSEDSSGSFGNGHLTTFALSGLRYVLYGGVAQLDKSMNFSGHAILASHLGKNSHGEETVCSEHGYYVRDILDNKLGEERFVFGEQSAVPKILLNKMDKIKEEWGHGALIAVIGFNNFSRHPEKVAENILQEVALNFFVAVDDGKLMVEVCDQQGKKITINKGNLRSFLEKRKEEKRTRKQGFPCGSRIWSSYETKCNGDYHEIKTDYGNIALILRQEGDRKRIVVCRNGMWITEKIPMTQGHFTEHVNFDALLLINAKSKKIHELFKLAEPPLHNDINITRINDGNQRKELQNLLIDIRDKIADIVEKKNLEGFDVEDMMGIRGGTDISGGEPRHSPIKITSVEPNTGRSRSRGNGKTKKKPSRSFHKGRAIPAKISSRRLSPSKVRAIFKSEETCEDVELQVFMDDGKDSTCVGPDDPALSLTDIRVDGKQLSQDRWVKDGNGNLKSAFLGGWEKGQCYNIEISYDGSNIGDRPHALKYSLTRRKAKVSNGEEKTSE